MNKTQLFAGLLLGSALSFSTAIIASEVVFTEDFSGDFSNWVGKEVEVETLKGSQLQNLNVLSKIVDDPMREGKKAAQSTVKVFGGDFISQQIFSPGKYSLSFDYMGTCKRDCGGTVGYGEDFPGVKHHWLAGTTRAFPQGLQDNTNWNRYTINFNAKYEFHLIFEQWTDSIGEEGTVFFADISLTKH
jgi:chitinase